MDEIRCLQVGEVDFSQEISLPAYVNYTYMPELTGAVSEDYHVVILGRSLRPRECPALSRAARVYCLFALEDVELSGLFGQIFTTLKGQLLAQKDLKAFLQGELRFFYDQVAGGKLNASSLSVPDQFKGQVQIGGHDSISLEGDFGSQYYQIGFWRENVFVPADGMIDIWLEYQCGEGVELALVVTSYSTQGEMDRSNGRFEFDAAALQRLLRLQAGEDSTFFFALFAKGQGSIEIGTLHHRRSRGSHGYFLPGGERHVTANRQELFSYFEPGNRKAPLAVYFGGYNDSEGFEGLQMLRRMGTPFLLLSDVRLEGGAFFIGDSTYEELVMEVITSRMRELGMTAEQLVLSGISMGAYGALYYASGLMPHAVILGKPLANLGDVAYMEKHVRPFGFGTSLDVLQYLEGGMDERAIAHLNGRLWNRFDKADFSHTKFIVAHMLEDDYDPKAYNDILAHMKSDGVAVYGKGIHGRHSEHTDEIVKWFGQQFAQVVQEDF